MEEAFLQKKPLKDKPKSKSEKPIENNPESTWLSKNRVALQALPIKLILEADR